MDELLLDHEKFYDGLCEFIIKKEEKIKGDYNGEEQEYVVNIPLANVKTRGERMSETKSFFAIISFLAFYVALIFVMGGGMVYAYSFIIIEFKLIIFQYL